MISPYGVDGGSVDELACFGRFIGARFEFFPIELHSCGFQNALGGRGNLGSNAFAGNQSDFVSHGCIVLYAKASGLSKARGAKLSGRNAGTQS
jgi:hypothetical protein